MAPASTGHHPLPQCPCLSQEAPPHPQAWLDGMVNKGASWLSGAGRGFPGMHWTGTLPQPGRSTGQGPSQQPVQGCEGRSLEAYALRHRQQHLQKHAAPHGPGVLGCQGRAELGKLRDGCALAFRLCMWVLHWTDPPAASLGCGPGTSGLSRLPALGLLHREAFSGIVKGDRFLLELRPGQAYLALPSAFALAARRGREP